MSNNKSKYLPSIDSLRALAVLAVIIYHVDVNYLPGGFLGVDLFFVLSGYLISSLIIKEYRKTGSLNLYNFYIRRARRLLPAVYFMITVGLVVMVLFNEVLLRKSHLDAIFGYIYSSNWWYIFHKLDYFDSFGAQSPFKHLWSLAIEEQFYMIFPLLFLLVNRKKKSKDGTYKLNKNFLYVVLGLILVSLIAHILLFDINNISRIYFGTDTRAFSLLVGVVGAILYPMERLHAKVTPQQNMIYSVVSLVSIATLITVMIYTSEYNTLLYRGGFLLVAILGLIVIISSGKQHTLMSRLLSFKPVVFIGKISYSLYLWHFPVLVLTTPVSEIGNPNIIFVILRVILTFILATASYVFVETPIRKLGFKNYINIIFKKLKKRPRKSKKVYAGVVGLVSILFLMGIFGKSVPFISTAFVKEMEANKETQFVNNGNNKDNNQEKSSDSNKDNKDNKDNKEDKKNSDKKYSSVLVMGDSLTVDIGEKFQELYSGAVIDGKIGRQLYVAVEEAKSYSKYNNENSAVIFQLGTNGPFTESQIEELVKEFDKADIYFVNIKVPRAWEKTVNTALKEIQEKHSNVKLIDWYSVANSTKDLFEPDRVHLNQAGIAEMVTLIEKNLKRPVEIKAN
ncbi:acyltransferase family protein [Gemella haemolysans]|uniref:Acyltransferase n=1 Tax=Gemella haemolysans ATCC 10379 TaxID=546270 RepID=C5NX43_9BACL|nr:acyltransferase family protein [Gemella haemolysans]EER68173.1 acyltransferase [Gemella haemolysans ATCC 10379]KAA8706888.1 acetyltransferase [Gemella haemolysans]UBH81588.1 acetyltransferase [Gemella haemolysans]VEI38509.1 O-acetyltransferase OatA [Gemella haemolysans]